MIALLPLMLFFTIVGSGIGWAVCACYIARQQATRPAQEER